MTDIVIQSESVCGVIGIAFREVQVNEVSRFTDPKNWTDFFWEW